MIDQAQPRTMQVPGAGIVPRGRPTTDFKEYPKMMTHPQYKPGKPSPPIKHPSGFTYHGIGEPIRFPPVLVKHKADEEYHASQGYVSQGKCDAAAFDRAVGAGRIPEQVAYKPLEYPKWVQGKLCQNKEEADRWEAQCGNPADAIMALTLPAAEPVPEPETRAEKLARIKRELAELEVAEPKQEQMDAKRKRQSDAIKAGLARRKQALTESGSKQEAPDNPV